MAEGLEQVKGMFDDMVTSVTAKIAEVSQKSAEGTDGLRKELETQLQEIKNKQKILEDGIAEGKKFTLDGVDGDKFSFAKWAALSYFPETRKDKSFGLENEVLENMQQRDAVAGNGSTGGYAVPTNLASYIVDPATATMPLRELGCTFLNGVRGVFDIPAWGTRPAAGHTSENGTPTKLNFTMTQVHMTPKRAAGYTIVSRRLLRDSPLSLEAMIRNQLTTSMQLAIESGAISGTGANNQPTGILNQAGMSALQAAITGQFTIKQASQMMVDLQELDWMNEALANGKFGFLTRPIVAEGMRMARQISYSGQTVGKGFQINNAPLTNAAVEAITGAKVRTTTLIPVSGAGAVGATSSVVFGNWVHAIVALWSGLEVRASDVASDGTNHSLINNTVMIAADQDYDFCLDNPAAFVKTTAASSWRADWTEY